jgi:hypothetical protein
MADASESRLNIDAPVEKRGRGCPRGSKNKTTAATMGASSSILVKRRPGRPVMTHKYRGSQQSSRELLPKFIDSTQGKPKIICKP